jgi:hypothetical protein
MRSPLRRPDAFGRERRVHVADAQVRDDGADDASPQRPLVPDIVHGAARPREEPASSTRWTTLQKIEVVMRDEL